MIRVFQSPVSRERLDAARDFVESFTPATELLVVGATRAAADDFVLEAARGHGATFGIRRLSFMQLVAQLASTKLAAAGLAPATSLGAQAVAARAAFEARARGALPYFEPVSKSPGFARALAASLHDLRHAAIQPEQIAETTRAGDDLGTLAGHFATQLGQAAIADRAAMIKLATYVLTQAEHPWRSTPLLLLDVPIPTALERELVQALCEPVPEALITVASGDQLTLQAVDELAGRREAPSAPDSDSAPDSSLARLHAFLFADAAPPAGELDSQVTFTSAPGEGRECVEIARRIHEELARGVPADQIAVFLRAPHLYSKHLEAAFRRASIPFYFARGTLRPDPAGRAFLALLACASERLSARRFAEHLSFGQVPDLDDDGAPPTDREVWTIADDDALGTAIEVGQQLSFAFLQEAEPGDGEGDNDSDSDSKGDRENGGGDSDATPAIGGTLRAPWRWEQYLVEAAVIGGSDRWRRRLTGLDAELRTRIKELRAEEKESPRLPALERRQQNLKHLEAFALPIIETLDAYPASARWGEWLQLLTRLAPMVLRYPKRVLAVLAELEPMASVGPVALDEVRDVLAERLSTLEEQRPPHRYGCVYVATPGDARGRSFRVVFVPGLAERVFPQRPREDPILLDGLRDQLTETSGAWLPGQRDRTLDERLLLRLAIGAAEERVHVSYPRVDVAAGRQRVTSFYGLDIARAIRGRVPDPEELERQAATDSDTRLAWPAPRQAERAIDAVEHDLAVLGGLLGAADRSQVHARARYLLELNPHLKRSLRSRWQRWRLESWTPADGLVRSTGAIESALAVQRPNARPYSPTALQRFATCPYQFLLSAIHRLEPREEAVPLVQLDPLTRGRMFHQVQSEFLRELAASDLLPVTGERLPKASALLDKTVANVAAAFEDELAPAILKVWEDEVETMRTDLRAWLRYTTERDGDWVPSYFEFGFGLPSDPSRDPRSVSKPAILPGGWQLRGAIDLIEESADGSTLRVTDHKTGRNRTREGMVIQGGEVLQPVIYSLVVEALTGKPVKEGRLFFCTAAGGFTERVVPMSDIARHHAAQLLETIDAAITAGRLPAAPHEKACDWCDFRSVCGPNEVTRTRRKERSFTRELEDLRGRP